MTRQDKIDNVRNNIILGAQVYANELSGKYYLYIFENNCFEMYYGTDNLMHLTGAGTRLSPFSFIHLPKVEILDQTSYFSIIGFRY